MVSPELSQGDVWFVHPFGFDFEYYIVPDPQYEGLLAASNTGVTPGTGAQDSDYVAANNAAHDIGLDAPKGVLGVETDQGLVPPLFRNLITNGARIATFGRWIVDCGHNDFHTEIHAPLLMAVATPSPPARGARGGSQMTSLQIMSRPYTVSQQFAEGNFIDHLLAEVAKVETTILGIPLSWRVEAHPTIFTTPYEGRPFIKLLVQPPPIKLNPVLPPPTLMVSYHFTHRAGVAVQVYNAGNGTVGIAIVLGDLNPATLPPKHDLTVQWSQLGRQYSYVIDALQIADILTLDILSAIILNRGILTDIYDAPSASSPSTIRMSPRPSAWTNSILGRIVGGRQPAVPDLRLAQRLVAGPAGRRRAVSAAFRVAAATFAPRTDGAHSVIRARTAVSSISARAPDSTTAPRSMTA